MLFMALITAACDKLEASDVTGDTLVGRWAFSYTTSEPLDFELAYRLITFNADGTCSLIYNGGQLDGTYRASQDVIRIEGQLGDGRQQLLLWKVLTMSPYRIVTEYNHQLNDDRQVTITVTLDKLSTVSAAVSHSGSTFSPASGSLLCSAQCSGGG